MKKWKLIVLPLVLTLTACQEVTFGFVNEKHSAGMDNPSYSYHTVSSITYSYQSNESINVDGLNKATLTFGNISVSSSDIREVGTIASYVVIDRPIFDSVNSPEYFGVLSDGTVYLGAYSSFVIGQITFNFTENIKNVVVTAQPYYSSKLNDDWDKEILEADQDVAMSVNNSGYIKLDTTVDQEAFTVPETKCAYNLGEGSQNVTIRVGSQRAIIKEIALYY